MATRKKRPVTKADVRAHEKWERETAAGRAHERKEVAAFRKKKAAMKKRSKKR